MILLRRVAVPVVALVAAALLVAQAWSPAAATTANVEMTMRHSRFDPVMLEVERGTTLTFELTNADPIDHELIVGDDETHAKHRVGREQHHHGEVPGEVSVPAGATATTTYTFDTPGDVLFACHLPGHEAYGMTGVVRVR
jgi:uncharacterized cupredoxin-like copper-binding protein